jgi:hypothetical protein
MLQNSTDKNMKLNLKVQFLNRIKLISMDMIGKIMTQSWFHQINRIIKEKTRQICKVHCINEMLLNSMALIMKRKNIT